MAYARFTNDSDVYVFASSHNLECVGCNLHQRGASYYATNNTQMIRHLKKHVSLGSKVPESAFERLRDPEDAKENEKLWKKYKK